MGGVLNPYPKLIQMDFLKHSAIPWVSFYMNKSKMEMAVWTFLPPGKHGELQSLISS
jgi:hypothetical protein